MRTAFAISLGLIVTIGLLYFQTDQSRSVEFLGVPLTLQFKSKDTVNLDYFSERLVNIPVGWWISEKERTFIVDCLNAY